MAHRDMSKLMGLSPDSLHKNRTGVLLCRPSLGSTGMKSRQAGGRCCPNILQCIAGWETAWLPATINLTSKKSLRQNSAECSKGWEEAKLFPAPQAGALGKGL